MDRMPNGNEKIDPLSGVDGTIQSSNTIQRYWIFYIYYKNSYFIATGLLITSTIRHLHDAGKRCKHMKRDLPKNI